MSRNGDEQGLCPCGTVVAARTPLSTAQACAVDGGGAPGRDRGVERVGEPARETQHETEVGHRAMDNGQPMMRTGDEIRTKALRGAEIFMDKDAMRAVKERGVDSAVTKSGCWRQERRRRRRRAWPWRWDRGEAREHARPDRGPPGFRESGAEPARAGG